MGECRVRAVMRLTPGLVAALYALACTGDPADRVEAGSLGAGVALAGEPTPRDTSFAALIDRLSEPSGYFDTDNLISNESSYLHVLDELDDLALRGGAYIGVGPDQNFSYMARLRPDVAFIIDIRRDNLLQHLFFKSLFALAQTRVEYLALLFGAGPPDDLAAWRDAEIDELITFFSGASRASTSEERARRLVRETVSSFGVRLDAGDLEKIAFIHGEFIRSRLQLRFHSFGRRPQPYYPTLGQLLSERDRAGDQRSYLAREEDYEFLRDLQARDRVIPVVGDLSGDHALAEIGVLLEEMGEAVTGFYTSNVEFYLMGARTFDAFAETVAGLPTDPDGVFIRSYFQRFSGGHPKTLRGYASTQLTQPLAGFVEDVRAGGYASYMELVYAEERVRP